MRTRALVSVIVPCFNDRATLPWALASLIAQTHPHWECILVDDGSTDLPGALVHAFADPRMVLVELRENRGPAGAREAGLRRARGDFIALLDADDWAYPTRLDTQLAAFAAEPDLAAVASGMAVVDAANRLIGVRGCVDRRGTGSELRPLPSRVGRPTVMLRAEAARSHYFDADLRQTEDSDYLGRVLDRRPFRVLPQPLYAYRDDPPGVSERALRAHALRRRYLRKLATRFPGRAAIAIRMLDSYLKSAAYSATGTLGLDPVVAAFRNASPSDRQRREYEEARKVVAAVVRAAGFE